MREPLSDRLAGALAIGAAAVMAWGAQQIQESFIQDPLGPKAFPWLVAAVLAAAGLFMVVRPDESPHWPGARKLAELGVSVLVMIAYAWSLPHAGFVISTSLAAAYLSWRLGGTPKQAVVAGVLLGGGIFLVFSGVLGLSLATTACLGVPLSRHDR